ncbi:hypothetical protein K505DRAFT_320252 [Melanomma pulvis-pyrius CBS 109.77]|uniref:Uncharacterized protein n=1 Tax=Melanomma pulvis-pyrius CBS 109.77 TaxID=1314802 RepID=A0A6A6XYN2_9PLEO|nr:hypothetical protein K505DRAFT_320252 [Melanomma pulvis-pyrius CBS 109.77]
MSTSPHNGFTWTETRPGRWERDIDEAEQFYTSLAKTYEGSGRMFFAITGHISLCIPVPEDKTIQDQERRVEDALRKAWIRLRYDHPTIGGWVEYDENQRKCVKVYETFLNDEQQKSWLDNTFHFISTEVTGAEWCNSDPPTPKLPTLFVISPPTLARDENKIVQRDLIFRSPHDIIDGIGTLQLFNNLCRHASEAYYLQSSYEIPLFGSEVANLSPPFRVAANLPSAPTQTQKVLFDETTSYNASCRQDCKLMGVTFKDGAILPGKHQRVSLTLSKVQTTKLLQACRRLGASLTHAFHTAIAMSIRDMQKRTEDARPMRYINYCLINERGRCAPPFSAPSHAAAVYHSVSGKSLVVDLIVPGTTNSEGKMNTNEKEFKRILKDIKHFYYEMQHGSDRLPLIPLNWTLVTPPYPIHSGSAIIPPVPRPNSLPSVSISSMGVIENIIAPKHGLFELHNPWVTGEELGTGLGVFLGTWGGQLCLSAAYNAAWHDDKEVLEYLKNCMSIVLKCVEQEDL